CRKLDSGALIGFHSVVKDINNQLKQLFIKQKNDGTLEFPLIVYRGQCYFGEGELEKLTKRLKVGDLISMNSFLSTSKDRTVATVFGVADRNTSVLFQIKVNDVENNERLQVFADITSIGQFPDEKEVLFGMSSVFQVTNVYLDATSWVIEMELTNYKEDEEVEKFLPEIKRHLYRISTKRRPFNILKKLLNVDTNAHPKPLIELMKFILTDLVQIFIVNAYKKNGQLKSIITKESNLRAIVTESNSDPTRPSETCIGSLCDVLDDFLCDYNNNSEQDNEIFINDISISILCFGAFLLLIEDYEKCIQFFQIILRNESVDKKLKIIINSVLNACYALNSGYELSIKHFYEFVESSALTLIQPWNSAFVASPLMATHGSNQLANQTLENSQPSMYQQQHDIDIHEQLRLLYLAQLCREQQKPVDALNYYEEALEINSSLPSSALSIFNGPIYLSMASTSLSLDNKREALFFLDKAIDNVNKHFPSSHRIFATLNLMRGYYLLQNERTEEANEYVQNALNNIHFSKNQQFHCTAFIVLATCALQCGNINGAKKYCEEARKCSLSTFTSSLADYILQAIPNFKIVLESTNLEVFRQMVRIGLQYGQQIFSSMNSNALTESINEETSTPDKLISSADFYRHRQEYANADKYYRKAIEKMTDSNETIWIIFRKMIRMNYDNELYQDYFIEQYSKYDIDNLNHLKIISTLQLIIYKLCLSRNETEAEFAFDFLTSSCFTTIKYLYHCFKTDSEFISKFLNEFFHYKQFSKFITMITELIEVHTNESMANIKYFLSNFKHCDEFASIIHHSQVDKAFSEMKLKYDNDESSKCIFRFLDTILQVLRQCVAPLNNPTLSFREQILQLLAKHRDESTPFYYLKKILESFFADDLSSFFFNLDKFRLHAMTYEHYKKLKESLNELFEKIEENQLHAWLKDVLTIY
ncbi:unnamed protein product, partial [Rotaria sp. Silwood2]